MGKKVRTVIRGNTVYEIDKFSKKPKHIMHNVDAYFKLRNTDDDEDDDSEREIPIEPKSISSHDRFKNIKKLAIGNSGKLPIIKNEADGLDKEIIIDETEHDTKPNKNIRTDAKYIGYDSKYRKSKKSSKLKRKKIVKKCRCKK
jgi:hypothetical protein